ncbi:MAG: ImmA/IrrE family metallo-endopeptidase [Meiothermus sp.]|nr:ImmA/IrrE family metallo-endopeptidase [Meiothermus sp.]
MELRQKVLEIARRYRLAHAPLSPERLAAGVGTGLQYGKLPEGKFGAFLPEKNQILIDQESPPRRQRFTLAHEVMHVLIQNDDDLLSDLHEAYEGTKLEVELENLCNLGAAEMLLPAETVEAAIAKKGQSPKLIPDLAESHQVSEEVVIIALAERGPTPSVVLMAGSKPLRVYFSAKHPRFFDKVSRGTGFRRDDPVVVAFETGLPYKGRGSLPSHSATYGLEVYPKNGRVYAVYRELLN